MVTLVVVGLTSMVVCFIMIAVMIYHDNSLTSNKETDE